MIVFHIYQFAHYRDKQKLSNSSKKFIIQNITSENMMQDISQIQIQIRIRNPHIFGQVHLGTSFKHDRVYVLIETLKVNGIESYNRQFTLLERMVYQNVRKNIFGLIIQKIKYNEKCGLHLVLDQITYDKKSNFWNLQFSVLINKLNRKKNRFEQEGIINCKVTVRVNEMVLKVTFENDQIEEYQTFISSSVDQANLREHTNSMLEQVIRFLKYQHQAFVLDIDDKTQHMEAIGKLKERLKADKLIKKVRIQLMVYFEREGTFKKLGGFLCLYRTYMGLRFKVFYEENNQFCETDEHYILLCRKEVRTQMKSNLNLIASLLIEYDHATNRLVLLDKEDIMLRYQIFPKRIKYFSVDSVIK